MKKEKTLTHSPRHLRLLSALLAALMIFGMLPLTFIFSYADPETDPQNNETDVLSMTASDVTVIKHTHKDEWGSEDFFKYFVVPRHVRVEMKNGTVYEGSTEDIWEETWDNFDIRLDQSAEWDVGTHEASIGFHGFFTTFNVNIIESPVTSVVFENETYISEGMDMQQGYHDDGQGHVDTFDKYIINSPVPTVYTADGVLPLTEENRVVIEGEEYGVEYDDPQDVDGVFQPGGRYEIPARIAGFETSFFVNIVPTNIASVTAESLDIVVNTHGRRHSGEFYDPGLNQLVTESWYIYDLDPVIDVKYTNGGSFYGRRSEFESETGLQITTNDNQDRDNHWKLGDSIGVTLTLGPRKTEFTVNIVESPVKDVTFDSIIIFENEYQSPVVVTDDHGTRTYYEYSLYQPLGFYNVEFKDGSTFSGSDGEFDHIYGDRLHIYTDQSETNVWKAGKHTALISLLGFEKEIEFTIEETPIADIEAGPVVMFEGQNQVRRWDDELQQDFFAYDYDVGKVRITFKNGEVYEGDLRQYADGRMLRYTVDDDQSASNLWNVGHHESTLVFMGFVKVFDVEIEESPIAGIEIEPVHIYTTDCYESSWSEQNDAGEWVERPYFRYEYSVGPCVLVMKSGERVEIDDIWNFANENGFDIRYYDDQSPDKQWGVGKNTAHLTTMGFDAEFDVYVDETPIKDIVFPPVNAYYGNTEEEFDWVYDESTDNYESKTYQRYNYRVGDVVITFKDDSTYEGNIWDYADENGLDCRIYDDQGYGREWGLGDHVARIVIQGFEKEITVSVIPSPIKEVHIDERIVRIKDVELVDDWYWDDDLKEDIEYRRYRVEPESVTIVFNDDTTLTSDLYRLSNDYGFNWYVEDGQGPGVTLDVGKYKAKLNIAGFEKEYEFEIIESKIARIYVDSPEKPQLIKDCDGYMKDGDAPYFAYTSFYELLGEDVYAVLKDETVVRSQRSMWGETFFEIDGINYPIEFDDGLIAGPWDIGENTGIVRCGAAENTFKFDLIENPIKKVTAIPELETAIYGIDGSYGTDNRFVFSPHDVVSYEVEFKDDSKVRDEMGWVEYDGRKFGISFGNFDVEPENWVVGNVYTQKLYVMGVEFERKIQTVNNDYVSLEISGKDQLTLTLTKADQSTETMSVTNFEVGYNEPGRISGQLITDKKIFSSVVFTYDFSESRLDYDKSLTLQIGGLVSNALDGCVYFKLLALPKNYALAAYIMRNGSELGKLESKFKGYNGTLDNTNTDAAIFIAMMVYGSDIDVSIINEGEEQFAAVSKADVQKFVNKVFGEKEINWSNVTFEIREDKVLIPDIVVWFDIDGRLDKENDKYVYDVDVEDHGFKFTGIVVEMNDNVQITGISFKNDTWDTNQGDIDLPWEELPDGETLVWGDANGDEKVSSSDIVRLKKYFAALDPDTGTSTVTIYQGADANGDGKVSSSDIVRLKKYFAALDPDTEISTVTLGPSN